MLLVTSSLSDTAIEENAKHFRVEDEAEVFPMYRTQKIV